MPTPEELTAQLEATMLADAKQTAIERFVSHMNGVGASLVQQYPMAEVQSWTIQKGEAEALLALPALDLATASTVAPFLLAVTEVHFGPVEDEDARLAQLVGKANDVKANADAWAQLAAYVNGLRARVSDQITAAATQDAVYMALNSGFSELATWRQTAGV